MAKLSVVLNHLPTGDSENVTGFGFNQRLNTISAIKLSIKNPYKFQFGDKARFKFPVSNVSGYLYDFYGIVRDRNLKDKTITIYDYGTILQKLVSFNRDKYIGEDFLLAIKDIVETVDEYDMIDITQLHGTDPAKLITDEDDIHADNEPAIDIIKKILKKVYDDSNNYYILPYFFWFENIGIMQIEKQQDINDSTNYPAVRTLTTSDMLDVTLRESDEDIANIVTCVGAGGAQITEEDENSIVQYSGSSDFRKHSKKIKFDSPNLDELQQKAIDYINLHKEVKAEYDIEIADGWAVKLNTILNLSSEEYGINGRFLITGIKIDSNLKTIVTVSGAKLSIVDVL